MFSGYDANNVRRDPAFPYDELFKVLVVDDIFEVGWFVGGNLAETGVLQPIVVETAVEALYVLSGTQRIHAVVFDLGMRDLHNDEWCILDYFWRHVPFAVYTACQDNDTLVRCAKDHGAKYVVLKAGGEGNVEDRLLHAVCCCIMHNVVNPARDIWTSSCLPRATDALRANDIAAVAQWAAVLGVDLKTLHHACTEPLGMAPLELIKNCRFNRGILGACIAEHTGLAPVNGPLVEAAEMKELRRYYLAKKDKFDKYLFSQPPWGQWGAALPTKEDVFAGPLAQCQRDWLV